MSQINRQRHNRRSNSLGLLSSLFLVLLAFAISHSEPPTETNIPVSDPSLVPLYKADSVPEYRWRAYGDIDKDGIDDIVVSEGLSHLSQNGVHLFIYFGDSTGRYLFYDSLFGSPSDLCFERDYHSTRLWTYWHGSASSGNLSQQILTDSGLTGGGSIRIYAGDGGTQMGRDLYNAVFDNCDVEFRVERYRIVAGKVEATEY